MKNQHLSESGEDLLGYLRSMGLFESVEPKLLEGLSSELERVFLPKDQTLFREGDPSDALYVVITGGLKAALRRGLHL